MKRWIVKQWIAFAEVTGGRVPRWIRQLVTDREYSRLLRSEESLTRMLSKPPSRQTEFPESLKPEINRRLAEITQDESPRFRMPRYWLPATAAMAVILFALVLRREPASENPAPGQPEAALAVTPEPGQPVNAEAVTLPGLPRLADGAAVEQLLLNPLEQEQAYLAADLSNAAMFVAQSIIPSRYMPGIRDRFQSIDVKVE